MKATLDDLYHCVILTVLSNCHPCYLYKLSSLLCSSELQFSLNVHQKRKHHAPWPVYLFLFVHFSLYHVKSTASATPKFGSDELRTCRLAEKRSMQAFEEMVSFDILRRLSRPGQQSDCVFRWFWTDDNLAFFVGVIHGYPKLWGQNFISRDVQLTNYTHW